MARFTDIFDDVTKQGRKIPTNEYLERGMHPIIDQGQKEIAGYSNEEAGLFCDVPAIIFGDHTRVIKYVDTPCFLGADGVKLLKAKKSNANYKYLFYALSSADIPNTGYNRHFKWLKEVEIPTHTENEQNDIVAVLDKVSGLIALRKQQLQKLDELVKSRFVELFGTCAKLKRLEEYASLITKGASPKWQGVDYCEEGVLFVTSENVREGYLDFSKRKYLDDKINEIQPRSMLKRNDILINIVGASIGRAAVYNCDEIANINQAVALVRVDYSRINQTYLMTYLNSAQAIEMYGKIKKGGARDNLSLQNIADLQIPVASMELQEQFSAFVKQTDKSKLAIQQSLDKLELLKKALMQRYFG
jgi:type I restriction enzyme S subunit